MPYFGSLPGTWYYNQTNDFYLCVCLPALCAYAADVEQKHRIFLCDKTASMNDVLCMGK